jgi:uncharacterized protein with ParB-like and HNH nuclease domain
VKADETQLGRLLEGPNQYVVPYFQRPYSWRSEQWNTLFNDIVELYELEGTHSHFLGSMVLLAEPHPTSTLTPRLLIDGQQRLVTLALFLAAIRDAARDHDPAFADYIHRSYLVNDGLAEPDTLKVVCTHEDRAAFATVIDGTAEPPASAIRDAYRIFRADLAERAKPGFDLPRLVDLVVSQLTFVAITLDSNDNPYRIFESLNAKGMPLTQGDLLRNYFFMRLPTAEHDHWYRSVWSPMQRRLGERLDDYMRDFLAKDGAPVRPNEVYQEWRRRLAQASEDDIRSALTDLAEWSVEYDQILHPQRETDPQVRKRLHRLSLWSNSVTRSFKPFLLRLQADYRRGELNAEQITSLFLAIESFFVRRLFTAAPATDENQLLIELYNQASRHSDTSERFIDELSRPNVGWPDDGDFVQGIVRYPLYFASRSDQPKLILEALEDSFDHRAMIQYDQLDLRLITPLLPRADWLSELGVTETDYWKTIGTLGNFTWVPRGRQPDLNVADRKRELLRMTRYGLELVRDFSPIERWTRAEIDNRSHRLATRALTVWPGPRR